MTICCSVLVRIRDVSGKNSSENQKKHFMFKNVFRLASLVYGLTCWPLLLKFAGSKPAEAVGFLRAKKSSTRLSSEGK